MPRTNKTTQVWLSLQKIKAYLRAKPLTVEVLKASYLALKSRPSLALANKIKPLTAASPAHSTRKPETYLTAPLLIIANYLGEEEQAYEQNLSSIQQWMRAINLTNYKFLTFPSQLKGLSITHPHAQKWLTQLIENTNSLFILSLGEDVLSFFTEQPVLLDYIHGLSFTLQINKHQLIIIPTYTPKCVFNEPRFKRSVWQDLQRLVGIVKYETTHLDGRSRS